MDSKEFSIQEIVPMPLKDIVTQLISGAEGELTSGAVLIYFPHGVNDTRLAVHNLDASSLKQLFHYLTAPDMNFDHIDSQLPESIIDKITDE